MPSLFSESESKIYGDILRDVVDSTLINRVSPGSKTRTLARALSKKLSKLGLTFDANIAQAMWEGAHGEYLDSFGSLFNVQRSQRTTSRISFSEEMIQMYVDVGNFGGINGGQPITIPAGTIISTRANGEGIRYRIPIQTILDASASEKWISAEAEKSGTGSNVGKDSLIHHNFTNYSDSLNKTLKVRNAVDIAKGQRGESDANYRYRISQAVLSLEKGNYTAIRLAVLAIPGVASVRMNRWTAGIGTFDVLIQATTPKTPLSLIAAVQAELFNVESYSIASTVRAPVDIGLSLVGTLSFKDGVSTQQKNLIIDAVTRNLTDYINNLDIGEEFIVNEAVERVMGTSESIKNIGTAGKPFDEMYIYYPSRLNDNRVRNDLIADYTPEDDEKISVELSGAGITPILFRAA